MDTIATYVTPAAYLALEAQAEHKSEYHDGVISPMPGAQPAHLRIESNVHALLSQALAEGYEVWTSNAQVHIPGTNSYVYPDVIVTLGEALFHTTTPVGTLLNPTLIVEVLSTSTQGYDTGSKFQRYQTIPTFQEYLLIDQYRVHITHWTRTAAQTWQQTEYTSLEEVISLHSLPAELPVAQVYRRVVFV